LRSVCVCVCVCCAPPPLLIVNARCCMFKVQILFAIAYHNRTSAHVHVRVPRPICAVIVRDSVCPTVNIWDEPTTEETLQVEKNVGFLFSQLSQLSHRSLPALFRCSRSRSRSMFLSLASIWIWISVSIHVSMAVWLCVPRTLWLCFPSWFFFCISAPHHTPRVIFKLPHSTS
jgi:hypothetical protein